MPVRVAERIAKRNKARIDALARAIEERGLEAAMEYAQAVILGNSNSSQAYRSSAALGLLELLPEDRIPWQDHEVNMILRGLSAELIAKGQKLPPALCAFAAKALLMSPPAKRRGRPSDTWLRELVYVTLRDLKLAGITVYEGDGSNGRADFTGVQVVFKVIEREERTLRKWWQDRSKEALAI